MLSVNFIVELPQAHGYDAIMVVVDLLSKRAYFIPMHTTVTAEGIANLFLRDVWKHHGTPQTALSDRGSQFIAEFTRELYRLLSIGQALSTCYHLQTDSQTERVNQELEGYLRSFTNEQQDDWDELLPLGKFTYNNHIHLSTQQTLFMVDTRRNPRMGFEPQQACSSIITVNDFAERMKIGTDEAKAALVKVKDEYAIYYNRHCSPAPEFEPGDMVWLDSTNIATTRKLLHWQLGPYAVRVKVGHTAYRLTLPPSLHHIHNVFPVVKLSPAPPRPHCWLPLLATSSPLVLVDGTEEFEVEAILDSHMRWNQLK